jgi:antitoxin (DNA-binding transcriptional repressor) of toxin-antitoxin stability system
MKTLTVDQAKPELAKLVEEAHAGSPVILVLNEKLVKLERYVPFDPEEDSPELEAMLLKAVTGPHTAYSRKDSEDVAAKVRREMRKK